MLKKVTLLMVFVLFLIGLSACDQTILPQPTIVPTEPVPTENIETFDRLFNDAVYKTITIRISKENWDDLDEAMLDYHERFGNFRTDVYARADMTYQDDQGIVEIEDVGFRTRGNLSRVRIQNDDGSLNRSHFKISFKEDFGLTELDSNRGRTVFDLEEIDMKYNRNDDAFYLTEKMSLDLFRAMGVPAAQTTFAQLFIEIDGTTYDYGLYTLFEPIDKQFTERRFGKTGGDGDLYKVLWQQFGPASLTDDYPDGAIGIKDESRNYRPSYDLKNNKKTSDHTELKTFIEEINQLTGSAFKSFIDAHFDVDLFLRYLAVGVVLGNPDDYRAMGNNYYFYQHSVTKKWMIIPYDYDHGLGQGWDGAPVFSNWTVGADIYQWGNLNEAFLGRPHAHPLSDKILMIPEYQLAYETYLEMLITESGLFSIEHFMDVFMNHQTLYASKITEETFTQIPFGLRNLVDYMNDKSEDIASQLDYYRTHPSERQVG